MRNRPHGITSLLTSGLVTHALPTGPKPRVLLSFDDGPTDEVTQGVLERLAAFDARAAFFVIGNRVEKNPDLLLKVAAEGHAVGNHSHTHPSDRWPAFSPYMDDIMQCNRTIEKIQGKKPTLFRAPEGRLHPPSIWASRKLGLQHVLWSLDSNDWQCTNAEEARQAAEKVLSNVHDRDIILLHEYAHWTLDLLDVLLPGLVSLGFDLATGVNDLS